MSCEYYHREDTDSHEALYEEETGERDVQVICSFIDKNNRHFEFVWQRSKSNENLEHGFTHYLSRYAYADEFRIVNGKNWGDKVVEIKTDKGKIEILCAMSLTRFGVADDEERGISEEVLLLVRQEKLQDGKIRLISCYPVTNDSKYHELYVDNLFDRIVRGSKRPDRLDKMDKVDESILSTYRKSIKESSRTLVEQVIRENKTFYVEHFKKGCFIFQRIIAEKKIPFEY
jgi:hypothetical protein